MTHVMYMYLTFHRKRLLVIYKRLAISCIRRLYIQDNSRVQSVNTFTLYVLLT